MKDFKILILLFIFLPIITASPQIDNIKITENKMLEICGLKVLVGGIWMHEGKIKADISYFTSDNGKPITGGYKRGDKISFPGGCDYYIFQINKTGIDNPGYVILSKSEPLIPEFQLFDDYLMLYTGRSYAVDTLSWFINYTDSASIIKAFTVANYRGEILDTLNLDLGTIFWNGECAYKLDTITVSEFNTHEKILRFKKQTELFYNDREIIPGEFYNRSYNNFSHPVGYIIRKMKIFNKMNPTEDEIKNTQEKFWLLKLYFYPRNISSPVIEIEKDGEKVFAEYDAIKDFGSEEEAIQFVKENNITLTDIK